MKSIFKPALISVLLATAGFSAFSQTPTPPAGADMGMGMNPAQMQARMDKRQAALKAKLKLSAEQEADWTTYVAAMKPPADMMARRAQHGELAKLPTPERVDKMKALRNQHMGEMSAAMDKRGEAIKAFYATLTPEQKQTFDAASRSEHNKLGAAPMGSHDNKMEHMRGGEAGKHHPPAKP